MGLSNPLDRAQRTPSGCIEWQGKRNAQGYGMTSHKGRHMSAHRKAWFLTFGAIDGDLCVLHRCDNPPCINPKHLFLGTHADNAADRDAKGRNGGDTRRKRTTHCANGHEYTDENTYTYKRTRYCRECVRAKTRRYYYRQKAAHG
jgi:hypothetical protein